MDRIWIHNHSVANEFGKIAASFLFIVVDPERFYPDQDQNSTL
jgi:hypothetical protein